MITPELSPKRLLGRFNEQLAQFERETSNQVVVAVYSKMESDSSIEDYTQRVAQAWGVGGKERRNGAVLFVFIQDRKMYIQVGYGLEGTLPDVTAFDITERRIKPFFRKQDYQGGLATGIDLICKAIRGEYKGDGRTTSERTGSNRSQKAHGQRSVFIHFLGDDGFGDHAGFPGTTPTTRIWLLEFRRPIYWRLGRRKWRRLVKRFLRGWTQRI
jgi:uncharacterized membrane protein YgcG